jgi:hypothetical protein
MNAATLTPARLDARRRVAAIRDALAVADDLLAAAYAARDWEALGHADWLAYCAAELPELRHLKMRAPPRRAARRRAAGRRRVHARDGRRDRRQPRHRPRRRGRSCSGGLRRVDRPRTRTDRVVALLIAAGPAGLTVHQLARKERCHHGAASAALSRLAAAGRVHRLTAPRGVTSPYVVTES